jgi:3-oxoacyl-[acyl-carrier protein] reductase
MKDVASQLLNLEGKNALVTGGSRGLGGEISLWLARAGAKVAINYRSSEDDAARTLELIEGERGTAYLTRFDVTDSAAVSEKVAGLIEKMGKIHILVNNAGISKDGLLGRMKDENWEDVISANLKSAFYMCREVGKNMIRNRQGRIINVTSVAGETGNAGQVNYSASKAGLIGLTKSLARELAPRNITVNAVSPGIIEGGMSDELTRDQIDTIIEHTPLRRLGARSEVAYATLFLASDMASYITGQVIRVNGGLYV